MKNNKLKNNPNFEHNILQLSYRIIKNQGQFHNVDKKSLEGALRNINGRAKDVVWFLLVISCEKKYLTNKQLHITDGLFNDILRENNINFEAPEMDYKKFKKENYNAYIFKRYCDILKKKQNK